MLTARLIPGFVLVVIGADALQGKNDLIPWEVVSEEKVLQAPGASSEQSSSSSNSSGPSFALTSTFALVWTFFLNYFLLACVRSKNQYFYPDSVPSPNEKILEQVGTYVVFVAPMLCVLFFEVVKRFDVPPLWLHCAIVACSTAFCFQAVAFICSEMYFKKINSSNRPAEQERMVSMVRFWRSICNMSAMVQYGSVVVIIYFGIADGKVPMVVGHKCTLILTTTYMAVYLLLFILRVYKSEVYEYDFEVLKHTSVSMNFAPMLGVLCMGTQMAYEWGGSELTPDVKGWMLISTYSVVVQVLLVFLSPYLAGAELRAVGANGEMDFVSQRTIFGLLSALRGLAMIVMLVGVCFLSNALWAANPPNALKVSLYYFSCLYFFTYLVYLLAMFSEGAAHKSMNVLKAIQDAVAFCPMLCVLFLSVFVQASKSGATPTPPGYSLNSMLVGTAAVFTQVVMICAVDYCGKASSWRRVFLVGFYVAMMVVFASVAVIAFGTIRA